MATIRSEISVKSPFYISKHRYLELKHFCLQYPEWKRELKLLKWYGSVGDGRGSDVSKPVEWAAQRREMYLKRCEMVEQAAIKSDPDIFEWILRGVTEGVGYGALNVPCSKDYYYERYRKFFWVLDKVRENITSFNEKK